MLENIIKEQNVEESLVRIINDIHQNGPINPSDFEQLAYIKKYFNHIFKEYESKLLYLLGLFYKVEAPTSILEEVYAIFFNSIKDDINKVFTPVQAHAYKNIMRKKYFSFSAPTSAGKSYLFRELIQSTDDDIVIIVPSRALISEYLNSIYKLVDNSVLVLSFVENINTVNTKRRIFILTPERSVELFKRIKDFNISLFLLDEAQISEEEVRGLKFDSLVRRIDKVIPSAKIVFAHPFVSNPNAQLIKHNFVENQSSKRYDQLTVGKIFISVKDEKLSYFSPYDETFSQIIQADTIENILQNDGTLLIYTSKNKIYENRHLIDFARFIDLCPNLTNESALKLIDNLEKFIGASSKNPSKSSSFIEMMKKGVVIHHGSIPLKARLLIEEFVNSKYARICFSTATLIQGINMPFDAVWVDNFHRMNPLTLKNLIGRAGRTNSNTKSFEFGYVVIKQENVPTFSSRINETVTISEKSAIDEEFTSIPEDNKDIVDAIQNDTFNDDLHLTNSQVERLTHESVHKEVTYILKNLIKEGKPITGRDYYSLSDTIRGNVKKSFKKVFIAHLRRNKLTPSEAAVLSASIPILLWHIQGKSFSEMVSLRHAFLTERDIQRKTKRRVYSGEISAKRGKRILEKTKVRYSPNASSLPNSSLRGSSLFDEDLSVLDVNYDTLVYDTYDYLDKVISQSITDPLCAAFQIYYDKTKDSKAKLMQNYLRYGTNNEIEIWLLRYGFSFEEIELFSEYIISINEKEIIFKKEVNELDLTLYPIVDRYIY